MVGSERTYRAFIRTMALLSLAVWVGGSLICGAACFEQSKACAGGSDDAGNPPSCHASTETDRVPEPDAGCCCSQKLVPGTVAKVVVSRVEAPFFFLLPPASQETSGIHSGSSNDRRSPTSYLVMTPVLRTGPAVRSHAPPVLS